MTCMRRKKSIRILFVYYMSTYRYVCTYLYIYSVYTHTKSNTCENVFIDIYVLCVCIEVYTNRCTTYRCIYTYRAYIESGSYA